MKRKKNALFVKNLALFLIPMMIPLIILGSLSIYITQRNMVDQINKNNSNLLSQNKESIEIILNELDSLNLNFSTNPEIIVKLKRILSNPNPVLDLEDVQSLRSIQNFIDTPANAKPYIHSIYVTFENKQVRLLTTSDGLVQLDDFYDKSWYRNLSSKKSMWTELREVKRYSFETEPKKILTLYRKLGVQGKEGLLVLNIYADYINNLLSHLETYEGQTIGIVDENNSLIFSNEVQSTLEQSDIEKLVSLGKYPADIIVKDTSAIVSMLVSQRYGWKFISIVPRQALYDMPIKLTSLTLYLLLLSFISGLLLTYLISRKNHKYLRNIINIVSSAEKGLPIPETKYSPKDEFGFIIQNIVKTFVEQSYLKVQLSERKYKLEAMQLLALQSQINPHFLYNTLDTINWKILKLVKKPGQANQMVENLSDILKYCLDNPLKNVTLEDEIRNTRSYIDIQKVRYRDKFDVLWEYDEDVCQHKVIKLILQPLVENSIYHGIKEKEGRSLIKIKIFKLRNLLKISVIDNGLGIPRDTLALIRQNLKQEEESYDTGFNGHIGLYNINRRIGLSYGRDYGIIIKSRQNFGTAVQLYIPISKTASGEKFVLEP